MHLAVLFRKLSTALVLVLAATIALAQAAAPTTNLPPMPTDTNVGPAATTSGPRDSSDISSVPVRDLTIGIGDLLKVSVLGAPEYDQDVRVAGNGDIVIGLVGSVHVVGQTTEQAQDAHTQAPRGRRILCRSSGIGFRKGVCHAGRVRPG